MRKRDAIIAYLTWIGWLIALCIRDRRDEFTRKHLNQALCLNAAASIASFLSRFLPFIGDALSLVVFVFWIIGFVRACRGIWKPLPLVGEIEIL